MKKNVNIAIVMATLWVLLLTSLGFLASTLLYGTQFFELASFRLAGVDIGLTFRFDPLSSPLFAMVSALAVVIGHYSVRYLHGEKGQNYFFKYLLGLIFAVSSLVLANNLVMFFIMWVLTSYNLHKLLLFYKDRPNARKAALKKQIISRLGDLSILASIILIFRNYGTTDISELLAMQPLASSSIENELIGIFLVIGAMIKSAQFPFHSWLPETMETPTPVSALMHAGVINAGGFLIIRFSPILQNAVIAHGALILIGAFTALFASLVMITQNNIKSKLAFSTIGQMGIMLFSCGLGAYGIALFHIIAHSFYKAHAFLSTGHLIEDAKKVGFKLEAPGMVSIISLMAIGLGLIFYGYTFQGGMYLALFTYGAIMLIGLTQNKFKPSNLKFDKPIVFLSISILLLAGFIGYFVVESSMGAFLVSIVPGIGDTYQLAVANIIPIVLAFGMFLMGYIYSGKLLNPQSEFFKKAYIYFWNGGYIGLKTNRWLSEMFSSNTQTSNK